MLTYSSTLQMVFDVFEMIDFNGMDVMLYNKWVRAGWMAGLLIMVLAGNRRNVLGDFGSKLIPDSSVFVILLRASRARACPPPHKITLTSLYLSYDFHATSRSLFPWPQWLSWVYEARRVRHRISLLKLIHAASFCKHWSRSEFCSIVHCCGHN